MEHVVDWNAKESLDVKKLRKIFKRAKRVSLTNLELKGIPGEPYIGMRHRLRPVTLATWIGAENCMRRFSRVILPELKCGWSTSI